jgi:hypothetical protein
MVSLQRNTLFHSPEQKSHHYDKAQPFSVPSSTSVKSATCSTFTCGWDYTKASNLLLPITTPTNVWELAPLLQGIQYGQVPKDAFSHQILLESKELPANHGAPSYGQLVPATAVNNMPTILIILQPTAMEWHFFGGPLARHQYNGNTISIFQPIINTMAIQFPFYCPPSIQWQYNDMPKNGLY